MLLPCFRGAVGNAAVHRRVAQLFLLIHERTIGRTPRYLSGPMLPCRSSRPSAASPSENTLLMLDSFDLPLRYVASSSSRRAQHQNGDGWGGFTERNAFGCKGLLLKTICRGAWIAVPDRCRGVCVCGTYGRCVCVMADWGAIVPTVCRFPGETAEAPAEFA